MNLGIIGCGAIGTDVALAADEMKEIEKIYLQDIDKKKAINLKKNLKKAEIKPVKEFLENVDVVFEAASQNAVDEYAMDILQAGKDFIIMSVGSLFDDKCRKELEEIIKSSGQWDRASMLDTWELERIIEEGMLPQDVIKSLAGFVRKEKIERIFLSKTDDARK